MDDVGARNRRMIQKAKDNWLCVNEASGNGVVVGPDHFIRAADDSSIHEQYLERRVIDVRQCLKEAVESLSDVIHARFIANLEEKAKEHDDKVIQECKQILDDLGVEY